jgi:hypothetical protein
MDSTKMQIPITLIVCDKDFNFTEKKCELESLSETMPILDDLLKSIKSDGMVESTYGNKETGERDVDLEIRKSKVSTKMYDLILKGFDDVFNADTEYEYIEYNEDGHFAIHNDRKRQDKHTHTICIYPPQNIEGGELNIYVDARVGTKIKTIPMSETKWVCVAFPIETYHSSNVVTKGIKKMFKGIGISKETHKVLPDLSTRNFFTYNRTLYSGGLED